MAVFTPPSQVLERHESLFADKNIIIAGDIHDDYPLQIDAKNVRIHCTQYHTYLNLASRKKDIVIDFNVLPADSFYENSNTLIYYWPKNKQEAQFQLSYLLNQMPKGADIFIVGENRSGVKSAEALLANFGSIQKIDSARRCSLYYFQAESRLAFDLNEWWSQYHLDIDENMPLTISYLPGVFSQKSLDMGSELMLNALTEHAELIKGKVLDIGSGCGVLSAVAGKLNPQVELTLSDVSAMALESSKKTLQINNLDGKVIASDVFSHIEGKFDLIISNPPFHDGRETSYSAADALISSAKKHLTPQGKLCIVANTFLPYQQQLTQQFNHIEVLAQTTKFRVYLVY